MEGYLLSMAKSRAKRSNIEFDITKEDIIIPDKCPVLGVDLCLEHRKNKTTKDLRKNYGPSIDRIDSTKRYVKGNVEVISLRANFLKSDSTLDELEKLWNHYSKYKE